MILNSLLRHHSWLLFVGFLVVSTSASSQIVVPAGGCVMEDFDASNPWTFSGSFSSWTWDNPNKAEITDDITGGGNCLILGGNGPATWVNDNEDSQAESPVYDLSAATNPYLEFWFYWSNENSTNFDEIWMEYSLNGGTTWSTLEPPVGTGGCYDQNWYNFTDNWGGASAFAANNSSTGNCNFGGGIGPTGWVQVRKCVAASVGGQSSVMFRFRSDNGDFCNFFGATIDNFTVCDATLDASATATCAGGLQVNFTDNSAPCPDGWLWDFGDGNTSTSQNPTHTYASAGTYNVSFTASSSAGITSGCGTHNDVFNLVVDVSDATVTPAGPFLTTDSPQNLNSAQAGGTWSANCGGCINATTGVFDPAVAGAGTWQVCYEVGTAPCDDQDCINITVADPGGPCPLVGVVAGNNPTCYQFSDGSATINVTGDVGNLTFVITDSLGNVVNQSNSNTANNLGEGWYYFSVTDDGIPCTIVDSVFLDDPDELDATIAVTDPTCYGFSNGFAVVQNVINYTGDVNQIGFFWAPNSGTNGIGEDTLFNASVGQYTLTINDENGCSKVFDFIVNQPDSLYFNELGTEPAYCRTFSFQNGNGVAFAAAAGGTPDYDYLWINLQDSTATTNTTWAPLNYGQYEVTATDDNGCVITEIVTVDSLNPVADFDLTSVDFDIEWEGTAPVTVSVTNLSLYFANPNNPQADTTFFYSFGDSIWNVVQDYQLNIDTTFTSATTLDFCLVALNKNDCSDTLCVPITIYDPLSFTPVNVFTPNGDGDNDIFTFDFLAQSVAEFKCIIVNRWGNTVYELNAISDGWDGTHQNNGNPCKEGIYFYIYEGTAENGETFEGQGNIHLIGAE
jgi:gliding motility-associated-like protein